MFTIPTFIKSIPTRHLISIAFIQSLIATAGSLFFSEVWQLPPCKLCWLQRVAMFPIVIILGIGLYLRDYKAIYYASTLAAIGWLISLYHNLLYYDSMLNYGIIPDSIIQCEAGLSCTSETVLWLGFITIPLLALTAFSVILVSLWVGHRRLSS